MYIYRSCFSKRCGKVSHSLIQFSPSCDAMQQQLQQPRKITKCTTNVY